MLIPYVEVHTKKHDGRLVITRTVCTSDPQLELIASIVAHGFIDGKNDFDERVRIILVRYGQYAQIKPGVFVL